MWDFSNMMVMLVSHDSGNAIFYNKGRNSFKTYPAVTSYTDQWWELQPVDGQPNTYLLVNHNSGEAIFYNKLRKEFKTHRATPSITDQWWELVPVDGQPNTYQLVSHDSHEAIFYNKERNEFKTYPASPSFTDQWWNIFPLVDWDIRQYNIKFYDIISKGVTEEVIYQHIIDNHSAASVEKELTAERSKASTFEFTLNQTLAISTSSEFEVTIPEIASAKASISINLTLEEGKRWENTVTDVYSIRDTIHVPENSAVEVTGSLKWMDDALIPFDLDVAVRGKLKSGVELNSPQLKIVLWMSNLTGNIVEERNNELIVRLRGELRGSWGIKTSMHVKDITKDL